MKKNNFGISEILLFLVTIALFSLIVFFEINPVKAVSDSYNMQKEKEIESIVTAIERYSMANKGQLPTSIPAISSPLIVKNTQASGVGAGFNVMGNSTGIPDCIQAGAYENTCLSVVSNSPFSSQISPYIKNGLPKGDFYVAKNIYGTKVVVFCTDLGQGVNVDTKGYAIAYQIYNF